MTTTSQQQSQKETNENAFVGINVAKDELVVHILPTNQPTNQPTNNLPRQITVAELSRR